MNAHAKLRRTPAPSLASLVALLFTAFDQAGLLLAQEVQTPGRPARLSEVIVDPEVGSDMHETYSLRFAVAEQIGKAFFRCAERKAKPRSIHIMDQFGSTIYAARMDGQFADNMEVARMKAEAALYFRESTAPWLGRARDSRQMALLLARLGQFTSPVGLPIIVDNQLLGSVGIGGASGDCAHEALTVVLGPQPSLIPDSAE